MPKFSEDVLGAVRESEDGKLYNLEERLDLVRNHTYIPVSAPMGFRNAIAYGMELMEKKGEGLLVKGVSSGVLRMIVAIRNAIGGEVAERAPDRRPRVVFARVDSYDESSELIETLMDCMAVYIEKFGRGMGFRVNGCRFSDDPLLVLPEDAMEMVNEIIDRGGPLENACCDRCRVLYEDSPDSVLSESFSVVSEPRRGFIGRDGAGNVFDELCRANRGLLEVRGVAGANNVEALWMALNAERVKIGSVSMTPDVLVICPVGWGDAIPDWMLRKSILVESERPLKKREFVDVIGRGIERASELSSRHVSPHVAEVAASFALGRGGSTGSWDVMRGIEDEIEASGECLSHKRAFQLFFGGDDCDLEAMKEISIELYRLIEKDVRVAYGSSDERRFEHSASRILIQDYLSPLGFLNEADAMGKKDVSEERSVLESFESGMKKLGLLGSGSPEEINSLRNDVFNSYDSECRSLVYEGDGAFRKVSGEGGDESERSRSIDMGSFRYDRNKSVGEYIERTTLVEVSKFRREATSKAPTAMRRRVISALGRYYGYCAGCGEEAYRMVAGNGRFYSRSWSPLSGFRYEVR